MYDHTFFFNLKIARSYISPHIKWAVSLVFAYGHFNVPLGCEWVTPTWHLMSHECIKDKVRIRIRIRIYLLARRNLLWDILRLPSSRRAALGLYVILTLWRGRGANQPPYALLHRSSLRYALRHGRRYILNCMCTFLYLTVTQITPTI